MQPNKTEFTFVQVYLAQSKSAGPRLAVHWPIIQTQSKTTWSNLNQPSLTQVELKFPFLDLS